MTLARAAAVALSLLLVAWFALDARQEAAIKRADTIITSEKNPAAAELRRAERLLDRAATLNPDRTVDLLRARLELARGNAAAAQRRYEAITRAEPDNADAWAQLLFATAHTDRAAFRRAEREIRRLAPRVPLP